MSSAWQERTQKLAQEMFWQWIKHLPTEHIVNTSALSVWVIYIQYSLQLRNELTLHASSFKILSAGWNYVKTYYRAPHTMWNINVLSTMLHHQHFLRTLHLCSFQRAGLCVTGKAAGLVRPAGNPRAEPFLALSPSRLWNLLPMRYSKIS